MEKGKDKGREDIGMMPKAQVKELALEFVQDTLVELKASTSNDDRTKGLAHIARKAKEDLCKRLRRTAAGVYVPVQMSSNEMKGIDKVIDNCGFWLSRPIMTVLSKLSKDHAQFFKVTRDHEFAQPEGSGQRSKVQNQEEIEDTLDNDEKSSLLLEIILSLKNHQDVQTTIQEWHHFEHRITQAAKRLKLTSSDLQGDLFSSQDELASRAKHTIQEAYCLLMTPPRSSVLIRALRTYFSSHYNQRGCKRDHEGTRPEMPCNLVNWNTIDLLADQWLQSWIELCYIIKKLLKQYFVLARNHPLVLIEVIKVVELHETISENYFKRINQESFEEGDISISMMPVLLSAAALGKVADDKTGEDLELHDNFVELCIRTLSKSVEERVHKVASQAFYGEETSEARTAVLDVLVEDLDEHAQNINKCFPPRYNMGPTMCTFYSEHLAKQFKDLNLYLKSNDEDLTLLSSLRDHKKQQRDSSGHSVTLVNSDILSLINWIERFISALTNLMLAENDVKDKQLQYSMHNSSNVSNFLMVELGALRKVYVIRVQSKMREWIMKILFRDSQILSEVALEQANEGKVPLLSPSSVDIFSAIHSELHNVFENERDIELAIMSSLSIAELLLEFSEKYEAYVIRKEDPKDQSSSEPGSPLLRRMRSSPAVLSKHFDSFRRQIFDATDIAASLNQEQEGIIEYLCAASNNCLAFQRETSEISRFVRGRSEIMMLSNPDHGMIKWCKNELLRFDDLMKSTIIRFQHSSKSGIKSLVETILCDFTSIIGDLFQTNWLHGNTQVMATICATFHDYCIDISEYLERSVYYHFIILLFEDFVSTYKAVMLLSSVPLNPKWEIAICSDIHALVECARGAVLLPQKGNESEESQTALHNITKAISGLSYLYKFASASTFFEFEGFLLDALEEGYNISEDFIETFYYRDEEVPRVLSPVGSLSEITRRSRHIIQQFCQNTDRQQTLRDGPSTYSKALSLMKSSPLAKKVKALWNID